MSAPDHVVTKIARRLGYQPSLDQVKTVQLLAGRAAPAEVGRALGMFRGSPLFLSAQQWVWSTCSRLGFGETDRACMALGWSAMCDKAAELYTRAEAKP